jgi:hypothetical protein
MKPFSQKNSEFKILSAYDPLFNAGNKLTQEEKETLLCRFINGAFVAAKKARDSRVYEFFKEYFSNNATFLKNSLFSTATPNCLNSTRSTSAHQGLVKELLAKFSTPNSAKVSNTNFQTNDSDATKFTSTAAQNFCESVAKTNSEIGHDLRATAQKMHFPTIDNHDDFFQKKFYNSIASETLAQTPIHFYDTVEPSNVKIRNDLKTLGEKIETYAPDEHDAFLRVLSSTPLDSKTFVTSTLNSADSKTSRNFKISQIRKKIAKKIRPRVYKTRVRFG